MIDLTLSKSPPCISIAPAEGLFCLTNAYAEVAIIIVPADEDGPALDVPIAENRRSPAFAGERMEPTRG